MQMKDAKLCYTVIQNSKVLLYTETATNIIRDLNPFL